MISYLNYFKLRIITNLQYRAAAIAGVLTQLFFGFVYIMIYLALYESNKGVNPPMNLSTIVNYLWLQQAFFTLTYPYTKDQELLNMIKNGNLAYELIRPQNFYLKYYIKLISNRIVAAFLRSIPILVIGIILPEPYKLTMPSNIESFIIFVIALILSLLLVTALSMIMHILTIFFLDSRGITTAYNVVVDLFMGGIVPIPFFPKLLQKIAYVLPFRYISDFPYRVYSGDIAIAEGKTLLLGSFIWIIIIVFIGVMLSKYILKRAVIQGG